MSSIDHLEPYEFDPFSRRLPPVGPVILSDHQLSFGNREPRAVLHVTSSTTNVWGLNFDSGALELLGQEAAKLIEEFRTNHQKEQQLGALNTLLLLPPLKTPPTVPVSNHNTPRNTNLHVRTGTNSHTLTRNLSQFYSTDKFFFFCRHSQYHNGFLSRNQTRRGEAGGYQLVTHTGLDRQSSPPGSNQDNPSIEFLVPTSKRSTSLPIGQRRHEINHEKHQIFRKAAYDQEWTSHRSRPTQAYAYQPHCSHRSYPRREDPPAYDSQNHWYAPNVTGNHRGHHGTRLAQNPDHGTGISTPHI